MNKSEPALDLGDLDPQAVEDALPGSRVIALETRRLKEQRQREEAERKKAAEEAAKRPVLVTEAEIAARDLAPVDYLVDGLIPRGLAVLSAPPKIGKTWLNLALSRAVATGGVFLGRYRAHQAPVVVLDLEGNARRTKTRSAVLRAGDQACANLHVAYAWPRMDMGGLEYLEQSIVEVGARLCIIDIWARFRPPRPKNIDPYQFDVETTAVLAQLCQRTGCTTILTHHNRKSADADFVNELSGSAGLAAAADCVITISRQRGAADAALKLVGRDVEDIEIAMRFDKGVWSSLGDAAEYQMGKTRNQIYEYLRKSFPRDHSPKEISEETDLKPNAVKKALARMLADGSVRSIGGRYTTRHEGDR